MQNVYKCIVLIWALFSSGVLASSFCPQERPKENGVLLYASCSKLEQEGEVALKPWEDLDNGSKGVDSFATDEICACYAYKDSKVGKTAINITSIRYFVRADKDLKKVTTLYRNSAFYQRDGSIADKHLEKIENSKYDEFHENHGVSTRDLIKDFHAYLDEYAKERTFEPADRRDKFTFVGSENSGKDRLRRSYLIGFIGNQNGTWVPFKIGTGANGSNGKYLRRVDLKIADLYVSGLNGERVYSMIGPD